MAVYRKSSILFVLLFFAFILLPCFGALLRVEGEGEMLENRVLKKFPAFHFQALRTATFGKDLSDYIWDHLPLRTQLLRADHWLDYYLFRDSPVPQSVLLGKDGWLFLYPAVMTGPKEDAQKVELIIRLARRATAMNRRGGRQLYLVPSPNKAAIYPEFLQEVNRREYLAAVSVFHGRLQEAAAAGVQSLLLLWEPFAAEKKRLLAEWPGRNLPPGTQYLFRPRDRHFSWEASLLQAREIAAVLVPGKWDDRYYEGYDSGYEMAPSEMEQRFIKINLPEWYLTFQKERYLQDLGLTKTVTPVPGSRKELVTFRWEGDGMAAPLTKKLVVVHDSFFDQSRYFLAPYFRESVFIHWNVMANQPVFFREILSADSLVIQCVEGQWSLRAPQLKKILDLLEEATADQYPGQPPR